MEETAAVDETLEETAAVDETLSEETAAAAAELSERDQHIVDKWVELMRADFRTAETVEKVEPMIGWLMSQFGVTSNGEQLDPSELLLVLDACSDNLQLARESV